MKRKLYVMLALSALSALLIVCSGCAKKNLYKDYDLFAMDTYITLRFSADGCDGDYLDAHRKECETVINDTERVISAYSDSGVYRINAGGEGEYQAPEVLAGLMRESYEISSLTGGAYDCTLGVLVDLWNVAGGGPVPDEDCITDAALHTGTDKFTVNGNTIVKHDSESKLNFGAAGKGAAAERVIDLLEDSNITCGLVSLGGNIGVFGKKSDGSAFKIGIRDPDDENDVVGYLYIRSGFVSVSGDYERYFIENGTKYHHILDPATGYPAQSGLRSVAVYSQSGVCADALSTALFVMGAERSLEFYESSAVDFEAVFITDGGDVIVTPGIAESFELTNGRYRLKSTD